MEGQVARGRLRRLVPMVVAALLLPFHPAGRLAAAAFWILRKFAGVVFFVSFSEVETQSLKVARCIVKWHA
jgi:hypothetical protein